ncbi:cytochrome c oxidase subunit 1-like protein [Sulfurospirillum diekertiae]|uniref:Cytochrome c oxidase subunit 1-like protein n=1 Tax=Sulfurospirillum diekertiae TaxID=1854492 RepID=A0A290HU11_9BACT|nr:cbb3-type cytochrome c oxidase subunit I [Sulfurospirillum diekertiae]ATB69316.1 cytochrome c oxidase subunit 1-like protein [Sulfurospirillum diekertiae]
MEKFSSFIQKAFAISSLFLVLGLAFGFEYSLNLLGYFLPSSIITAPNARSVHVSLMLYGFVPLMLSFLPFVLMEKENIHSEKGLEKLKIYFTLWCIFLVFMTISLLMGVHRGLVFYDFAYELNFILAFSGLFYILALYDYIKVYKVIPLWIKVSLYLVIASPIALLVLMNPVIGQVEKTIQGPHGDNTLGMSFTLIPIFYLLIKLHAKETFVAKYHTMWIIPLVGYIASVAHRIFIGELSYNQEWFFQYLTFCYVPLLLKWLKDANITFKNNPFLVISIYSFLFVDIEGNILFIPTLRWLFHRNDLIVAHAHIAMGVGVFFMAMAVVSPYLKKLNQRSFMLFYTLGFALMLIALSMAGMMEAGFIQADINLLWTIRMLCGLFIILVTTGFFYPQLGLRIEKFDALRLYHLTGFLSDALGGIFLFIFADTLYPLLGFGFEGKYEYVVFAFMTTTGILHLFGLTQPPYAHMLAKLSAFNRIAVSAMFLSLYLSHQLGVEAMLIAVYDLAFASIYVIFQAKFERSLYV